MTRTCRKAHRYGKASHPVRAVASAQVLFDLNPSDPGSFVGLERSTIACSRRQRKGQWIESQTWETRQADDMWTAVAEYAGDDGLTHFVSHNLGETLAALNFPGGLVKHGFKATEHFCLIDPPVIFTFRKGKATLKILDLRNWFNTTLSGACESLGIQCPGESPPLDEKPLSEWNRQRAVATLAAFQAWAYQVESNGWGSFKPTIASQAQEFYFRTHESSSLLFDANERALALARNSFYGGKRKAFKKGVYAGAFYQVDMNSMYPHIMKSCLSPIRNVSAYAKCSQHDLFNWHDDYSMIGKVLIRDSRRRFPARHDGKIVYPSGEFWTTLADPELKAAMRDGVIKEIGMVALYQQGHAFTSFVDTLYPLKLKARESGNKPAEAAAKVMLNALYGKFGQQGFEHAVIGECEADACRVEHVLDADRGVWEKHIYYAGKVYKEVRESESMFSHPAIAASITSAGRVILWETMEKAGFENVYYCDTDGLIVDWKGWNNLGQPRANKHIGEWKLEGSASTIDIRREQDYRFGNIEKVAGVAKSARKIDANTFIESRHERIKELMRDNRLKRQKRIQTRKTMRRKA